jgi:hypothetical protein
MVSILYTKEKYGKVQLLNSLISLAFFIVTIFVSNTVTYKGKDLCISFNNPLSLNK